MVTGLIQLDSCNFSLSDGVFYEWIQPRPKAKFCQDLLGTFIILEKYG